jgi:hypothetical protein
LDGCSAAAWGGAENNGWEASMKRINFAKKALLGALSATAVAALALAPAAGATGTLDQQQTTTQVLYSLIAGPDASAVSQAQTFTAGLTGGLDQADLFLEEAQPSGNTVGVTVEIRNVDSDGAPGTTVLASDLVTPAEIPDFTPSGGGFVAASFSPPAPVTASTQYAIVAYTVGAEEYFWYAGAADDPGPYAGGSPFASLASPPTTWSGTDTTRDFAFKTYVVLPNSNPVCSGVTVSPSVIQPATRDQFKTVSLSGATDPDAGDTLSYHIDGVSQDEPVSGIQVGDDTTPDAQLINGGNSNQVDLRAERNPKGNGRVYRIAYTVTDSHGASCSRTIATTNAKVSVPRKKGVAAVDDYPTSYDSFTGAQL